MTGVQTCALPISPAAKKCHDKEKHKPTGIAFFLRLFGRFFRLRLGFFAAASGHVGRAYRAGRIDFPGFAFFRTGADSGGLRFAVFPVLQEREKVCVVHLI